MRFKINLAYIIRLIDSFPINEPDFFQESWPSAIYDSSSSMWLGQQAACLAVFARHLRTRPTVAEVWPLKEDVNGRVIHTLIPEPRLPVEEYLRRQGRFAHLFSPGRNEGLLWEIQARVDAYWENIGQGG